jgi:hypothetical protein
MWCTSGSDKYRTRGRESRTRQGKDDHWIVPRAIGDLPARAQLAIVRRCYAAGAVGVHEAMSVGVRSFGAFTLCRFSAQMELSR